MFKHLTHEYDNLYYSCHVCNNTKRDRWPDEDLSAKGYRFVDYCRDDFSTHFEEVDGRWVPKSRAAEYTEAHLHLRVHCKTCL